MHCSLIDKNPQMTSAWRDSFGFMDRGIEEVISLRLGWELQFELQKRIKELIGPKLKNIIGTSILKGKFLNKL